MSQSWQVVIVKPSNCLADVRRDGVDDFLPLRRSAFGIELAPLPRSLQLPAAEIQPNQALASPQ